MLQRLRDYWPKNRRNPWLEARFTRVHDENLWGSQESRSGWGSARGTPSVSIAAEAIARAVREHGVRSLHDIPCGDFNWMPEVLAEFPGLAYRGFDIVKAMLAHNRDLHPQHEFRWLDITNEVPPRADLILCKDLLNHLDDEDVKRAIQNMRRSGSTYLLASNNPGFDYAPLPATPGGSRHLDITAPPFGYPAPLWTEGGYMSLWRLADMVERGV